MKIHILFPFVDGPWGGGNQFLKALKNYLLSIDKYTENENEADIILFNASPTALQLFLSRVYELKKQNPNLIIINRVDGPIFYIRDKDLEIDKAFQKFNKSICDGTIYQSVWSLNKNYFLGMKKNEFEVTILNAPNPKIFNTSSKSNFSLSNKIKVIATSWSSNMKKGFAVYKWLDENLDFNKYSMTFVGNTPIKFSNIIVKSPMNSEALAVELKQNDIFITASEQDPCSNSLIEAMSCGLPAIGLNDGGHPEIISKGGEVFSNHYEIPALLDKISKDYSKYQEGISLPDLKLVGKKYFTFIEKIYFKQKEGKYSAKTYKIIDFVYLKIIFILWQFKERLIGIKSRFF